MCRWGRSLSCLHHRRQPSKHAQGCGAFALDQTTHNRQLCQDSRPCWLSSSKSTLQSLAKHQLKSSHQRVPNTLQPGVLNCSTHHTMHCLARCSRANRTAQVSKPSRCTTALLALRAACCHTSHHSEAREGPSSPACCAWLQAFAPHNRGCTPPRQAWCMQRQLLSPHACRVSTPRASSC